MRSPGVTSMAQYDTGYRLLFSHPKMVRDLLLGYVPAEWVAEADFSTLEHVNGSYVADSERQRHDDMVWRVKVGPHWLWVYLLLEFQSEPDRWMSVRMLVYLGLLSQHLIRENELIDGRLPPILPIVLYNGMSVWRAPLEVAECFVAPPPGLARFVPRLPYHLVDEARLKLHPLSSVRNFAEALFRLEHGRNVADLRRVLQALDPMLKDPALQSLRRAFGVWVRSLLRRKAPHSTIEEINQINDIMEADSMLAERIESWFDEATRKGMQHGMLQGQRQGEAAALTRVLRRRFGELSATDQARIAQAELAELECWLDRALDASTLAAVFAADDQPAA